jgi:mannose-6-phosphate isomerase-like protein (cupin superfamily)
MAEKQRFQRFRVNDIARSFPETAETLLLDTYLTDEAAASARVFRVYRETPAHYHFGSDEYLYVHSGRGTFWMGDASNGAEFGPGDLLFFKRRIVHALPEILEGPVVFLAIDTPRRDPKDIIFLNRKRARRRVSSAHGNDDASERERRHGPPGCGGLRVLLSPVVLTT